MSLNDLTAPAKEAKSFDAWFFKQSKKSQDKMREAGVIPYREMVQSRHIFNIDPNHPAWATVDTDNVRHEAETFFFTRSRWRYAQGLLRCRCLLGLPRLPSTRRAGTLVAQSARLSRLSYPVQDVWSLPYVGTEAGEADKTYG